MRLVISAVLSRWTLLLALVGGTLLGIDHRLAQIDVTHARQVAPVTLAAHGGSMR